ncbi:MAG: hypothetical protein AAF670_02285 [Planctomycetota bacterium]
MKIASVIMLTLVVLPCFGFWMGGLSLPAVKWLALAGTVGWFAVTPIWMGRPTGTEQTASGD